VKRGLNLPFWCLCVTLLAAEFAMAQGQPSSSKPNFSGTWELESHSDDGRPDRPLSLKIRLDIAHRDPELTIVQTVAYPNRNQTEQFTFYTDGRGEKNDATGLLTNTSAGRTVPLTSQTKWRKQRLMVRGSFRQRLAAGRTVEVNQIEEWELSGDGRTLTQIKTVRFENQAFDMQPNSTLPPIVISTRPVRSKRTYRRVD
jgi:hypothetical protein